MGENAAMPMSSYSVRTINRQTGASEWVRVRATSFDDARDRVEAMGLVPHEVRIDEPGEAAENVGGGRGQDFGAGVPPPLPAGGWREEDSAGVPPRERGTWPGTRATGSGRRPAPTARVALLVSAIANLVMAAGLLITGAFLCFPLFMGVPLLVLGIYELRYRNMLDEPNDPRGPGALVGPIRTIAVLEICTIVLGNVVSMVCGIVVLANQRELEEA